MLTTGNLVTEPQAFFRALWRTIGTFILVVVMFTLIATLSKASSRTTIDESAVQAFAQGEALVVNLLASFFEKKNDAGAESSSSSWWW